MRKLPRWAKALFSSGFIGVTIFSLDLSNCSHEIKKASAGPSGLEIEEWETKAPPCAYKNEVNIVAKPSLSANLFEWYYGNSRLLESARRNAQIMLSASIDTKKEDLDETWHLLSYGESGYRAEFRFGTPRGVERRRVGSGRNCNIAFLWSKPDLIKSTTCSEMENTLQRDVRQVTAVMKSDLFWHSYEYEADYSKLELNFVATFCRPE